MSDDALRLPIEFPDADRTQLQLQEVIKSLGAMERQVLEMGAASEANARKIFELTNAFTQGRLTAGELREQLVALAGEVPRSADALRRDAAEAAKKYAEEMKRAGDAARTMTDGVKRATDAAQAQGVSLRDLQISLSRARGGFSDAWEAVDTWVSRVNGAVDRVAALASEQERLDRLTSRTGLNFDQAAAAAGRFADETEAAGAAGALLQAGVRVSQQELDALMRVAGATAQTLGITTTQATQQLTEALISGSTEGLRRFVPDLVSLGGEAHSASERMRALVGVAQQTPQAMDSATDSVARFRDSLEDGARTIATSFVQEWQRLSDLGRPFRDASTDAEELNRDLQAMGQTAAHVLGLVGNTIGVVAGFVATSGAATLRLAQRGINALQMQDDDGRMDTTDDLAAFTRARARALIAQINDGDPRTSVDTAADDRRTLDDARRRLTQLRDDQRRRAESERLARRRRLGLDDDDDEMSGANTRADLESAPTIEVRGRAPGRGGGRRTDPFEARLRQENAAVEALREIRAERERVAEMLREARASQEEQDRRDQEVRSQTARDRDADLARRQWGRSDAGLRAENDNARLERQESRALDLRRQNLRSFTDFFEEEHGRQIVAAQEAASGVSMAFDAMGQAYSRHLQAVIAGREDLGQALQGMLADTLKAISEESGKKAGLMFAEGLAALVFYQYDRAATAFAAGAAYTAVAVGTGYAGAAIAPTPAAKGSGDAQRQSAEARDRVSTGRSGAANDNAKGTTIVENHYYSPVIGGREATDGEVGRGMQRYQSAADRRRLGRTGTGP